MPIELVLNGRTHRIYAWGSRIDKIVLSEFLKKLKKDGHKDLQKILRLLKMTSELGVLRNPEFVKKLYSGDKGSIFEFRANDLRVFWFYDNNRIICTHGLIKKSQKTPKKEIEYAKSIQKKYLIEKKGV